MKKTGIILVIAGAVIAMLALLNVTYFTQENIVDAGELQINARKKHSVSWSPYVGVAIMVVGGGAYVLGSKRSL